MDEKPVTNEIFHQYQRNMENTLEELGHHVKKTSSTSEATLLQATKTNGRVNGIEGALVSINEILKSQQDKINSLEETRTKNKTIVVVASIIATPTALVFGWLGKLYIDQNNRTIINTVHQEIIGEIDDKITVGINQAFNDRFSKIKVVE